MALYFVMYYRLQWSCKKMASEEEATELSEPFEIDEKLLDSQFPKLFYVSKPEDAYGIIREYELKTVSKFITYRETKGFGHFSSLSSHIGEGQTKMKRGHKILWTDGTEVTEKIPYDGIPYILLGSKIMDCMYGPDRCKSLKAKKKLDDPEKGELSKKKKSRCESRKVDCPAQIYMREVQKFPEFKIPFNSAYNRRVMSKGLRKALQEDLDIGERRIYVSLPRLVAHQGHTVGRESEEKFSLDPRVRDKIYEMVYQHIFNTAELQKKAYDFVKNELFHGRDPPPMTNRRYFPNVRVIKSYCYQARIKMRNKGIDVPLPKVPERTKKPGPPKKSQGGTSKGRGDEGNAAAHSLLLLDQPIREEEVDTTSGGFEEAAESAADNLGQIESIILDKEDLEYQMIEKQECLTLLSHLKTLTEATTVADKGILSEVKGHLLEAVSKLHSPLMLSTQITENPAKKRKLQDEMEDSSADTIIPIRLQKDPTTNKHVVIIDSEAWPPL
ncbi:Calcium-responsive transcription factor [Holothuria leucospilota]|uniref:Calcium-responsive transcription factor n=1 Tax=Holothuria leucospilota TaxID=206669 RepID=A0A9Q0YP74_HOLLE|nr:Calcium-responsive transcription factor [Holothuria leucospilota]